MQTVRELCLIKPPQALPSDTQEDADELLFPHLSSAACVGEQFSRVLSALDIATTASLARMCLDRLVVPCGRRPRAFG